MAHGFEAAAEAASRAAEAEEVLESLGVLCTQEG